MIPHQSVAHCPGRLKTPRATGRPLDENTQYGIRQFSAHSSNLSISLDKMPH
jgi:hypothetical protein